MRSQTALIATLALMMGGCISDASAQINEGDTLQTQIRVVLNGYQQSGNVEFLMVRGRLNFSQRIGADWVIKTQNNFLYQEFYQIRADKDFASRNYLYYKTQNTVYPYLIAFLSGTYRRDIESRTFAGIGTTWHALNKANHSIRLSANIVYEDTWFAQSNFNIERYDENPRVDLWRCALYTNGNHSFNSKSITITYEAFYQPALQYLDTYRIHTDVQIDFNIWKGLSINAAHAFTWESLVVESINRKDTVFGFGLSYQWKQPPKPANPDSKI